MLIEHLMGRDLTELREEKELKKLLRVMSNTVDVFKIEFEQLKSGISEAEQRCQDRIDEYQQTNEQLEAELDLMEANLEKLRIYESAYHTKEQKL